jgi:hypothetical protein
MANIRVQSGKEMSGSARAALAGLIDAAKPYLAPVLPYLAVILIATILMSIWIGLRAS